MQSERDDDAERLAAHVARVTVFDDPTAAAAEWDALQAIATISPYQTRAFLTAWCETEGRVNATTPMIVVAYDDRDRPIALLPLGRSRVKLLWVARFLGGKHVNYNLGLFEPSLVWRRDQIGALLRQAAASIEPSLDVYGFVNQPMTWDGAANPLTLLPSQPSPSFSHRATLNADPDRFFNDQLSARSRKTLRSKRTALERQGPVSTLRARTPAEIDAVLAAYLDQKSRKFAALGIRDDAGKAEAQAFLHRAAGRSNDHPASLELHALLCGDRIVATFGGLGHAGRFSGLIMSYDDDPATAKTSPGDLLLVHVLAEKCREGFASVDLGIGEARYKATYCPITDPLVDGFVPVSILGRVFVWIDALRLYIKRRIKQSPRVWALALRLRKIARRGA
ncbi:GNAT family N-acetyltransferase [Lichenihabitans psoromatis]|uniref:GNAT family N-acetyltransferase n=1 Tax=Lichenihabitans psoromatis TaxID=2528642 RepID=UPI0010384115|nr:GNAT family N-acetyltransferase [Lichenihabitans psoromatis]